MLDDCDLIDMNLVGYPFTWERGHGTDSWIEVRLERALISTGFTNYFSDAKSTNIEIITSDHCPLLLELSIIP